MESGDKYKASMRSLSAQPDKFSGEICNYILMLCLCISEENMKNSNSESFICF